MKYYLVHAADGDAESNYILGRYYLGYATELGAGDIDYDEANQHLKIAADKGNMDAIKLYSSHLIHDYNDDYTMASEGVKYAKIAAMHGDTDAMWDLGVCYGSGIGTEADSKESFKWTLMAAERGVVGTMGIVALDYEEGLGVEADTDKAIYWYEKAAEHGDICSMYLLGLLYEGEGDEDSLTKAISWYEKAAKSGDEPSRQRLDYLHDKYQK